MSQRKLFNARHELYAIMLMCSTVENAGRVLASIKSEDFFATTWGRETYKRVVARYADMQVTDGVLAFTSLVADNQLSEDAKERLEAGRKKFKDEPIDLEEVVTSLTKYRQLRRLNELSEHINNALRADGDIDPLEVIENVRDHITETATTSSVMQNSFWHLGTKFNMQPILERLTTKQERRYVPTGIPEFDDKNGGINYGSAMLIVGTTGGGKSIIAQNVGQNMAMYEDVVIVPLEMSEDEMVARMLAREGEVDVHKIASQKWTEAEQERAINGLKRYHSKVKKQGNVLTVFRPPTEMSIEEVFTVLHPYNYRVIIIDYFGLLKGADGDDQAKALGRIGRACKVYASNNNKVVIGVAQGNEEGKTRYARALMEHCVVPDTKVNANSKLVTAEHAVKSKARVITCADGDRAIEKHYSYGRKATRRITTESGRAVEVSATTPLLVLTSDFELVWKPAKNIKPGELMVYSTKPQTWPTKPVKLDFKWHDQ